jgi:hypothetical protein
MNHGRVVSTAEGCANFNQGQIQELLDEVHGHLTGNRQVFGSPF